MALAPKITEARWDSAAEPAIMESWLKKDIFKFDPKSKKKLFVIDTPPPTANSKWHIGGTSAYALIDMIARTARMQGNHVLFPWCSDRNGLPMEVSVEKAHKIKMQDTPREEFIKLCADWSVGVGKQITAIAKRAGLSCHYKGDFYYETDQPYFRERTQSTFIELWNRGLVYFASKPNNYCWECGTTIADAEIEYHDIQTKLVYLKFRVKETGKEIIIATTRPEMLNACAAVLYNPGDARYASLKGKSVVVPIYGKAVPLLPHPSAKQEFGSGLVMICSYGDYTDVRLFRELKLKPTAMINDRGLMTEAAGQYAGLRVRDAREKVIADLEKSGLIAKTEQISHRTPVCWRSKTPIEFVSMPEIYLRQIEFIPELRKIVKHLEFHPESHRKTLQNWLDAISTDWVVSRRRYYGTEIPIWYCKKCSTPWVPEPGKYYRPWKEPAPGYAKCSKCRSGDFVGETRTFDTWMDSAITVLHVTGYKRFPDMFKRAYPCAIRPQGKDIIRSWLYYTLLRCYQLTKKSAFTHVFSHGHGVDEHGEKMSKSKGNVASPEPILEKYGADSMRLWVASETSVGDDWRYSEQKIESAQKFLIKLWNISRFISMFPQKTSVKRLHSTDRWILAELNQTVEKCVAGYEDFNFFVPANEIKRFTWSVFADHYLEIVKHRAYAMDESALYTLHACLQTILKLFAPICPFITEKIWLGLYSDKSIHLQEFPDELRGAEKKYVKLTQALIDANSALWKFKKDRGLSLNAELANAAVPASLKPFADDLKGMHKIKLLEFGKETKVLD